MDYPRIEERSDQPYWNAFFSVLFAILLFLSITYLDEAGKLPWGGIPLYDATLMTLAVFRITRLLVYDRITGFLRDMFLRSRVFKNAEGSVMVERTSYKSGPLRTIHDLLDCPWCVGVWVSLIVVFSYLAFPFAWYVIFFLAIAGIGSLLQIIGNLVGWKAELLKLQAKELGSTQKDR